MTMNIWQKLTDFDSPDTNELGTEVMKKYGNTYIFMKKNENYIPVYVKDYANGSFFLEDANHVTLKLNKDTEVELFNFKPPKGIFNSKERCIFIYRNPARQFRRGICKDNTIIADPVLFTMRKQASNVSLSFNILQSVIDENFYSFTLLHEKLKQKEIASGALNRNFMISLSITKDPKILHVWYHTTLIGYIKNNKLYCKNSYFNQELYDNRHLFYPLDLEF